MVKKLVLFDKIHNITSERAKRETFSRYLKYINEFTKGFDRTKVSLKKLREFDKRYAVEILGPEEIFLSNILKKEIGTITEFKEVKVGTEFKGTMVDVGKVGFGIFVDCAILNPKVDVLLPLVTLREQLCNDRDISTRDIIKTYEFIENYPVYIKVVKIDVDKQTIQGELSKRTLDIFHKIVSENIEGIIASGTTKNQLKKALVNSGHLRDIVSTERFSFLEHLVLLKDNTDAPGIIVSIGKNLKRCKLSALRAKKISKLLAI
ncbi:MAG: DUF2110 family protein [Candidatus Lokiarchaeota archaeon]|nr:DUF2110 family protein [Candidatus Lokiarchaeota archaeon]